MQQVTAMASSSGLLALTPQVNAVAPGLIKTRITEGAEWDAAHAVVAERVPLRRVGEPEDMVEAVLCCLRAKYMTGRSLWRARPLLPGSPELPQLAGRQRGAHCAMKHRCSTKLPTASGKVYWSDGWPLRETHHEHPHHGHSMMRRSWIF